MNENLPVEENNTSAAPSVEAASREIERISREITESHGNAASPEDFQKNPDYIAAKARYDQAVAEAIKETELDKEHL